MKRAVLLLFAFAVLLVSPGCSWVRNHGDFLQESNGPAAGGIGLVWMARQLQYLKPEYLAGGLLAYGIYDPLAPTWEIRVTELDTGHHRIGLNMKRLATGGDGEARQIFVRVAQALAEKGGYAGFDELRYTEGIESTRPFARRTAMGEIRLIKSRHFMAL
ncbi:MAG: hypothetical protein LBP58_05345 [Azoarcus sp.]|jgi:hypothetical protein|nr:hypothetical protein [Azoarcus sp.]